MGGTHTSGSCVSFTDMPDPLARLPALAERLGVGQYRDPQCGERSASYLLVTKDGARYDLYDLINALLDRVDKVAR